MNITSSSKILKQIWGLLTNRWAYSCFALLTVQQIIEASSTIWLVSMMKRITNQEPFFSYLFLYLGALSFPYIPGCLALISRISWKQESQRAFIQAFVASNRNQIGEWSNREIKDEKLSILTAEGPNALNAFIDYVYDLYAYVLSVFLNVFALSAVVEPLFGIAYGISVLAVILVMKAKKRFQLKLTQKALTARIDLYQSLLAAWDNVLLGNRYNFNLWEDKTSKRVDRCLRKNVQLERFDQILAIVISLATSLPSLVVVVVYIYVNRNSVPNLTTFVVTLPVLFYILAYTYQTLSLIFRWNMHKTKLLSIFKSIQPIEFSSDSMEQNVKWKKIHILNTTIPEMAGPQAVSSLQELLKYTNEAGRVTLRGENGAGKSTLLMLIKLALSERAFFLPTQNQLSFVTHSNKFSTGESLCNRLTEIMDSVDVGVLLLDEWDANLDRENQERLSLLIDELSKHKCVIEVRHR